MAVESKYPKQMAFVGTETQDSKIEADAKRLKCSKAAILRRLIDKHYGLVDGEVQTEATQAL